MKLQFNAEYKGNWGDLQRQVSDCLIKCLNSGKSFFVEFGEVKVDKSYLQLKAIYKLFQLCLPHFEKWKPAMTWDLESIKEFIKAELGYTRQPTGFEISMMIKQSGFQPKIEEEKKRMIGFCKKIKQNISFADFTKEQAYNFVNELEVWAQTPDEKTKKTAWENVFLTNAEKEAYWASLEKMFSKKEVY